MKRSTLLLCGCLLLAGCKLFEAREQVTSRETVSAGRTNTVFTTNFVYRINAGLTNALGDAQAVARDVGGPWGGVAALLLGGLSAVLGRIAAVKSRRAAIVPALISGVENAANNADVKKSIQAIASAAGVEERLNDMVRKITR